MLTEGITVAGLSPKTMTHKSLKDSAAIESICRTDDKVESYESLVMPLTLRKELPLSSKAEKFISASRHASAAIVAGKDDRLIVVVGPCSIHDTQQALEYAKRLKANLGSFPDLLVLMRSYFEKPRTTVGWKGLINDPELDGSCQINKGLYTARKLLRDLTEIGMPLAVELLDTISPKYLSDLITWGAIGARTTESQLHRELASGTAHPVGFKNGTDGGIGVALDAMKSASAPHVYMGINQDGDASIVKTRGNKNVHVILRGGKHGPNFGEQFVAETTRLLAKQRPGQHPSVMIDCSHGNSEKDHRNQPKVIDNICGQLRAGNEFINGVMIESNINEGRQDIPPEGRAGLKYGVSITDACVDFDSTLKMLKNLQEAVVERRKSRERMMMAEEDFFKSSSDVDRFHFSINV